MAGWQLDIPTNIRNVKVLIKLNTIIVATQGFNPALSPRLHASTVAWHGQKTLILYHFVGYFWISNLFIVRSVSDSCTHQLLCVSVSMFESIYVALLLSLSLVEPRNLSWHTPSHGIPKQWSHPHSFDVTRWAKTRYRFFGAGTPGDYMLQGSSEIILKTSSKSVIYGMITRFLTTTGKGP